MTTECASQLPEHVKAMQLALINEEKHNVEIYPGAAMITKNFYLQNISKTLIPEVKFEILDHHGVNLRVCDESKFEDVEPNQIIKFTMMGARTAVTDYVAWTVVPKNGETSIGPELSIHIGAAECRTLDNEIVQLMHIPVVETRKFTEVDIKELFHRQNSMHKKLLPDVSSEVAPISRAELKKYAVAVDDFGMMMTCVVLRNRVHDGAHYDPNMPFISTCSKSFADYTRMMPNAAVLRWTEQAKSCDKNWFNHHNAPMRHWNDNVFTKFVLMESNSPAEDDAEKAKRSLECYTDLVNAAEKRVREYPLRRAEIKRIVKEATKRSSNPLPECGVKEAKQLLKDFDDFVAFEESEMRQVIFVQRQHVLNSKKHLPNAFTSCRFFNSYTGLASGILADIETEELYVKATDYDKLLEEKKREEAAKIENTVEAEDAKYMFKRKTPKQLGETAMEAEHYFQAPMNCKRKTLVAKFQPAKLHFKKFKRPQNVATKSAEAVAGETSNASAASEPEEQFSLEAPKPQEVFAISYIPLSEKEADSLTVEVAADPLDEETSQREAEEKQSFAELLNRMLSEIDQEILEQIQKQRDEQEKAKESEVEEDQNEEVGEECVEADIEIVELENSVRVSSLEVSSPEVAEPADIGVDVVASPAEPSFISDDSDYEIISDGSEATEGGWVDYYPEEDSASF